MSPWACFLFLLVGSIAADCPEGSKYDSYFNKCYKFFPSPMTFLAAEQKCNSIGGHLTDIQSAFENFFIAGEGAAADFWIGANLLLASNWTWTSNSPMTFTNWASGQPENSNPCSYVQNSDHTWGTLPCNTNLPFMCTINPNTTISPVTTPPEYPPPSTCAPDACPFDSYCTDDYKLYTRNCLCYKYFNTTYLRFSDAKTACVENGGMLVKIPSKDVNDFLTVLPGFNTVGSDCPWIGLSCPSSNVSDCVWADGTPLGNYRNFYNFGKYPDDGKWEDTYTERAYLCQKASIRANLTSDSNDKGGSFGITEKTSILQKRKTAF